MDIKHNGQTRWFMSEIAVHINTMDGVMEEVIGVKMYPTIGYCYYLNKRDFQKRVFAFRNFVVWEVV